VIAESDEFALDGLRDGSVDLVVAAAPAAGDEVGVPAQQGS
jgi:hypothetical protein